MFAAELKLAATVLVAAASAASVAAGEAAAGKRVIKGQVLRVTPEGRVVLSADRREGVKVGFEFDVSRAGRKLGAVKVASFDAKGLAVCEPMVAAPKAGGKNWGSGTLCPKCRGMGFTADIGTCGSCGRGTSSGAFKLCSACAKHYGKCQACGKRFKKPAGAPDIRVGDLAATRLTVVRGRKAPKPVTVSGLAVSVGPAKAVFGARDQLTFEVTYKNVTKKPLKLEFTRFLGSTALGGTSWEIEDAKTKAVWKAGSRAKLMTLAPAQMISKTLKPGESFKAGFTLPGPGQRFWQGGTAAKPEKTASRLPAGKYRLTVKIVVAGGTGWKGALTAGPAGFEVAAK